MQFHQHTWTFSIVHVRINVMRTALHLLLVINVPFRPPRESLHPQSTDHVTCFINQVVRRTLENVVSNWDVTCYLLMVKLPKLKKKHSKISYSLRTGVSYIGSISIFFFLWLQGTYTPYELKKSKSFRNVIFCVIFDRLFWLVSFKVSVQHTVSIFKWEQNMPPKCS